MTITKHRPNYNESPKCKRPRADQHWRSVQELRRTNVSRTNLLAASCRSTFQQRSSPVNNARKTMLFDSKWSGNSFPKCVKGLHSNLLSIAHDLRNLRFCPQLSQLTFQMAASTFLRTKLNNDPNEQAENKYPTISPQKARSDLDL